MTFESHRAVLFSVFSLLVGLVPACDGRRPVPDDSAGDAGPPPPALDASPRIPPSTADASIEVDSGTCSSGEFCAICGDGIVEGTEACDDGNVVDGDGCNATCEIEQTYRWDAGPFGACSVGCGEGTQSREVRCVGEDGSADDETRCDGDRPAEEQSCVAVARCAHGPWTPFGVCVGGAQSRTRDCLDERGAVVACELCGGACSEAQTCTDCASLSRNVAGGTEAGCNGRIGDAVNRCRIAGCVWSGEIRCTIGGSPSSATAWGANGYCL